MARVAKGKGSSVKAGTARKVNEGTVSVNLKGVEGRTRRSVHIAEGNDVVPLSDGLDIACPLAPDADPGDVHLRKG